MKFGERINRFLAASSDELGNRQEIGKNSIPSLEIHLLDLGCQDDQDGAQ